MFEELTEEQVKARITGRLNTHLLTGEGSFTGDVIAALAVEICSCYHAMDGLTGMFYVDETSGAYIDKQAAVVGITRKAGTAASCTLTVTGTDGAEIPAGTPFYTAAGLAFYLDGAVTVSDGTGAGTLTAAEPGAAYNIGEGEIVSTLKNYSGISGYTNGAASGGTDPETDEALVARYYARMRRSPTSGNAYHYQQWAGEVDGVGYARVISKWAGAGTVKVLLAYYEAGGWKFYANGAGAVAASIVAARKEGIDVAELSRQYRRHVDRILENGIDYPPHEVKFEQTIVTPAVALLTGAVVKIVLNLILISNPKIGMYGAPISSFVCQLIAFIIIYVTLKKSITVRMNKRKCIAVPVISGGVMGAVILIAYCLLSGALGNAVTTLLCILLCAVIYAWMILVLKMFTKDELMDIPMGGKIYAVAHKLGIYKE